MLERLVCWPAVSCLAAYPRLMVDRIESILWIMKPPAAMMSVLTMVVWLTESCSATTMEPGTLVRSITTPRAPMVSILSPSVSSSALRACLRMCSLAVSTSTPSRKGGMLPGLLMSTLKPSCSARARAASKALSLGARMVLAGGANTSSARLLALRRASRMVQSPSLARVSSMGSSTGPSGGGGLLRGVAGGLSTTAGGGESTTAGGGESMMVGEGEAWGLAGGEGLGVGLVLKSGMRTLSMTWITLFAAVMLAFVTTAGLPKSPNKVILTAGFQTYSVSSLSMVRVMLGGISLLKITASL
mmetsp:Transcript_26484/g.57788  ORF Transcript_26484/g.57788 Transcript_26484/m.57788 type:complete len:301 (-) Transcript_26484:418-1320(-)